MKSSSLLALVLVGVFVVAAIPTVDASGASVTVNKTALPAGSVPVGLAYYGGYVYYASYTYGAIYKVDTGTNTFTYLRANDSLPADQALCGSNSATACGKFDHLWYGMAVDSSGNLWLTRRDTANNGSLPGVSVVSTSTGTETKVLSVAGEWDGITVSGGYAYAAVGTTLYQINTTAPYGNSTFSIAGGGGGYYGFIADGSGNIWFSDIANGQVCEFNGSSVACYSGFTRPLGISIVGGYGYVAENVLNGGYEKFSLTTGALAGNVGVSGTTPYGAAVSGGNPVWTSSGHDDQVCIVGPTALQTVCASDGEQNFYAVSDGSGNLYVSYFGSSGVAMISGLVSAPAQSGGVSPTPTCSIGVETGNLGTPTPAFTSVTATSVSGYLWVFAGVNSSVLSFTANGSPVSLGPENTGNFFGNPIDFWTFTATVPQGLVTFVSTGTNPYVYSDCDQQAQPFSFITTIEG